MWGNNRAIATIPGSAIVAVDLGENFTVKGHHLSMIKDHQFDGRARADPHKHIVEFIKVCGMFRYGNTNVDAIKLKLFPSSLSRDAKVWFNELSPGVITTWEQMRQAFISRFFPPVMFDRLMGEIRGFTQHPNESLVDAWLRMKDLLRSCHGHGLAKGTIIQIFYHGLDEATQAILDAGGIFVYRTPNEAHQLLKDRVLLKLDRSKDMKTKPLRKTVAFTEGSDNSQLMEKMEALTTKIDSQFKEIKGEMKEMRDGCNSCGGPHPSTECDDKPMGGSKEEEANFAYGGYRGSYRGGGYRGNYYGRNPENWQDRQPRDVNRNSPPREYNSPIPPTTEKKFEESDFEKTMREFMHVNAVFTRNGKTYDPSSNPNDTNIINDDDEDEVDETEKEEEPSSSKQTKIDPPPLKSYKPKIPYPQRLRKEKIEERYAKFIDLIKEVKINIPLVDVLDGMPKYEKFLKDLVSNKSKMEQISAAFLNEECSTIIQKKLPPKLGDPGSFLIPCTFVNSVESLALADHDASINLMPYSLYASLSKNSLKPTKMSIRLANYTYQYPMGIAENMLVQVGKFLFPVNFIILQIEEDEKVPLILGRPFMHTADAIILVKNKELNLGVGNDRITFLIDKAMKHSHSNDDTCFRVDVMDEITEEELDALIDDSNLFLKIPEQEEEIDDNFKELHLDKKLRIKTSIQDPPTDLEMKPLPKHLEYAFLEKDSLLLVVISALLKDDENKRLVLVLKNHKEEFAWKTSNIPATFQRCMIAIFQDMLETSMEVFMDDFSVFGESFDSCLANLEQMLIRCKQDHLVLNWERCHFMVTEGIMLGHKVSSLGLEVDKAKIDVIAKLPPPTNVKGVRSF
ncbi:reverse transcriptase domain-containing protein [Tanacetum coccineum]|uniref:Reverse transcriptase domain-containing protein n=1 Tax=Tanacetum coccineum TaxID=301880 RepID=A0ABQ4YED7_9ASTR